MNIKSMDLNLLVVFKLLMETRSISQTAKILNLSQPALSHSLNRLRTQTSDPILVRSSRSMIPTRFALELYNKLNFVLQDLEAALENETFDVKKIKAEIKLKTTDYFEHLVLSKLLSKLESSAPGIKIITQTTEGKLPKNDLENGKCDLAIAGFFGDLPMGFFQQSLFKDSLIGLARKNHPLFLSPITLKKYSELNHVFISPEGKLHGKIDNLLTDHKLTRNIQVAISNFIVCGWICRDTNYVCTLPKKLGLSLEKFLPLKTFEIPLKTTPINIVQVWHEQTQNEPLYQFIRTTIQEICLSI